MPLSPVFSSFVHKERTFVICPMPEDGNCLFHAAAFALNADVNHEVVRKQTVEYIIDKWEEFKPFISVAYVDGVESVENVEQYRHYMGTLGTYGGDAEINALSEVYERSIRIYVDGNRDQDPITYGEYDGVIYFLYKGMLDEGHYDVLMPVSYTEGGIITTEDERLCKETMERLTLLHNEFKQTDETESEETEFEKTKSEKTESEKTESETTESEKTASETTESEKTGDSCSQSSTSVEVKKNRKRKAETTSEEAEQRKESSKRQRGKDRSI